MKCWIIYKNMIIIKKRGVEVEAEAGIIEEEIKEGEAEVEVEVEKEIKGMKKKEILKKKEMIIIIIFSVIIIKIWVKMKDGKK